MNAMTPPPGLGGLLAPTNAAFGPPPLPNVPGLVPQGMPPTGIRLGDEQVLAFLTRQEQPDTPEDSDQELPPALRRFAAGLRPMPKPEGVPWQQEIVYETVGKSDLEITAVARYYFKIAQNYDTALSRERITASQYYAGKPFGDEQPGRSQIVMTVVRDTIRQTLPSLLRLFTAVEDPISFEPISSDVTGNVISLATTLIAAGHRPVAAGRYSRPTAAGRSCMMCCSMR